VARQHALADDVATLIIIRIVVVIRIRCKANPNERTPVKPVMKPVMKPAEATVEGSAVETSPVEAMETTAVEATAMKTSAAVEAATATVEAATAAVEAATAAVEAATTTAVTAAMSRCNARLNQADRCQRQQSQYRSPRHASLLLCRRPTSMGHRRNRIIRRRRSLGGKLTVSRIAMACASREPSAGM
jgi:hypothetical protein